MQLQLEPSFIDQPAQATTLEVRYLRPMLESLPPLWRTAVDVGAIAAT